MKQQKADRRSQRTYRLVNAAFAELVVEKTYDEILVQDILDRAGISRTTFYAHYFDKEDVLNTIGFLVLSCFSLHSGKMLSVKFRAGNRYQRRNAWSPGRVAGPGQLSHQRPS